MHHNTQCVAVRVEVSFKLRGKHIYGGNQTSPRES